MPTKTKPTSGGTITRESITRAYDAAVACVDALLALRESNGDHGLCVTRNALLESLGIDTSDVSPDVLMRSGSGILEHAMADVQIQAGIFEFPSYLAATVWHVECATQKIPVDYDHWRAWFDVHEMRGYPMRLRLEHKRALAALGVEEDRYQWTVSDAARYYVQQIGKSVTFDSAKVMISRWCDEGKIDHTGKGRKRRINPESLRAFILEVRNTIDGRQDRREKYAPALTEVLTGIKKSR